MDGDAHDSPLMRYLHTILATPSPLAPYHVHATARAVEGDLVLLAAGPASARHHQAIVLGHIPPDALFARARAFYGTNRIDSVELAAPHAAVEDHLRFLGWQVAEEERVLVLDPLPTTLPPPPAELTIRRALDEATLEHFSAVSYDGERYVPFAAAAHDPNVGVLVGYVSGAPVASSRLSSREDAPWQGRVARPHDQPRDASWNLPRHPCNGADGGLFVDLDLPPCPGPHRRVVAQIEGEGPVAG